MHDNFRLDLNALIAENSGRCRRLVKMYILEIENMGLYQRSQTIAQSWCLQMVLKFLFSSGRTTFNQVLKPCQFHV